MVATVAPAPDDGDKSDENPEKDGQVTAIAVGDEGEDEIEGEEAKPLTKPRYLSTKQLCRELDVRLHEAMGKASALPHHTLFSYTARRN